MKAIGPLMWEHRLIERMVALMATELQVIRGGSMDAGFFDAALDFFRTYAERLHFRKEEDILFASLGNKGLSAGLGKTMTELIGEHALLVQKVDTIVGIRSRMNGPGNRWLSEMIVPIEEMLELYPPHMEKEDKHFFYPCLEYLSRQEQDEILESFREFDARLLQERYQDMVARLEGTLSTPPTELNPEKSRGKT